MAQQVITTFVDDIDGSDEDVQTVTFFTPDGRERVIDLSKKNRVILEQIQEQYGQEIAGFVESSRNPDNAGGRGRRRGQAPSGGGNVRPQADREQLAAIREWARQNGHEVSDRGRIPGKVKEAYQAAH